MGFSAPAQIPKGLWWFPAASCVNYPRVAERKRSQEEAPGIVERALRWKRGESVGCPRYLDHGVERMLTLWHDFLPSVPISHFWFNSSSITMHLPHPHLSMAAKSEACALPPRKLTSIDKYATLSPSFSRWVSSFPGWAWFYGPSQTFWKTSAVAQSRQEYLFLVSICIASSLGEKLGGGGRRRCGFFVPAREAPKHTPPLLFTSLSSSSSLGFQISGGRRLSNFWKISPVGSRN